MAVTKTRLGTNEDGTPQWHYHSDGHLVYTGPNITGTVTTEDGTVHDVDDLFTEVATPEQAAALADAVGRRFADEGHPLHDAASPFVATPVAVTHTPDGAPSQAFAAAVAANAPAGADSSPQAVAATARKG